MSIIYFFFFFNDTATTEIYTLSLHDALPISAGVDDDGVSRQNLQLLPLERLLQILRSEEHTSELQSLRHLVCRLLLEKKKNIDSTHSMVVHDAYSVSYFSIRVATTHADVVCT